MADESEDLMLDGVLDSLEQLGYDGPLNEKEQLKGAIDKGLASQQFVNVVDMLCAELKVLMQMEEFVTCPNGLQDAESFSMEMRSFVAELGCPHSPLVQNLTALTKYRNRLLLLDFLTSQLMAARLIYVRKQRSKQDLQDGLLDANPYSIPGNLSAILKTYDISKPPKHVTITMLLDKIIGKTKHSLVEVPKDHVGPSLVTQGLSPDQWACLDGINEALTEEYSLRRRMLLTRCNVTVKSFKWSDKAKNKEEEFSSVYQDKLASMAERAPVLIARVLATKKDILAIERTSHGAVRRNTSCEVNKVLMGSVPDRGGRPNKTRPPPEMPSFKKRTEQPPQEKRERGGYRGGGGRGKRGGANKVQGSWSGGGGSNQGDWGSFGDGYQGNWDTGGQDGHYKGGKTYGGHQRGGGRGGRGGQYHRQNSGQIYYS